MGKPHREIVDFCENFLLPERPLVPWDGRGEVPGFCSLLINRRPPPASQGSPISPEILHDRVQSPVLRCDLSKETF